MLDKKFDIIVIGSATRDVFMRSSDFIEIDDPKFETGKAQCFALGSKYEIKDIVFTTGGGGHNAAATFGAQGLKAACISVIGNDFNGKEVLEDLKRFGVDASMMSEHDDDFTAYSVIMVHPSGERTIFSYKGEGQHFELGFIPFDKLDSQWIFLDSLGGNFEVFDEVSKFAVEKGIKLYSNPGGRELAHGLEKLKPILTRLDIFSCNKEEGAELAGTEPENQEETLKILKQYVKGMIILTDGPNGAKVLADGTLYEAGVPNSPVVERTGAGDSFASGFLAEYIRSGDIKKAIQFATANASSVVTKFGSKAGILKKGDWGPWPLVEVKVS